MKDCEGNEGGIRVLGCKWRRRCLMAKDFKSQVKVTVVVVSGNKPGFMCLLYKKSCL